MSNRSLMSMHLTLKYLVVSVAVVLCFTNIATAQRAPKMEWQHCYGGTGLENSRLFTHPHDHMMIHTSDGGYAFVAVTNSYDGPVTGNHHNTTANPTFDFWLVKLDVACNIQWEKCYGGSSDESPTGIIQTSDGGYVLCGKTRSHDGDVTDTNPGSHMGQYDSWLVKTDGVGAIEWTTFSGSNSGDECFNSVIEIPDGYLAVGYTAAVTEEAHMMTDGRYSQGDAYIVKFDRHGKEQWRRVQGNMYADAANAILPFPGGGYIYAGQYGGLGPRAKPWVVRLDTAGFVVWQKTYGTALLAKANTIVRTPTGFIVGGWTMLDDWDWATLDAKTDAFVFTIDSLGVMTNFHRFGGSGDDQIISITPSADGNYIFAGATTSKEVPGLHAADMADTISEEVDSTDAWVAKFTPDMKLVWQQALGGYFRDYFYTALENPDQSIMLYGSAEVGAQNRETDGDISGIHGYADAWVVKLKAPSSNVETAATTADFEAYPNPAQRVVRLGLCSTSAVQSIRFYDLLGSEVFPEYQIEGTTVEANIRQLPAGVFVIKVSYANGDVQVRKFLHAAF